MADRAVRKAQLRLQGIEGLFAIAVGEPKPGVFHLQLQLVVAKAGKQQGVGAGGGHLAALEEQAQGDFRLQGRDGIEELGLQVHVQQGAVRLQAGDRMEAADGRGPVQAEGWRRP